MVQRPPQATELVDLVSSPTWMYEWDLGGGLRTAVMHPELPSVHETRAAIIEPFARQALAGGGSTALDLACSEGWFAHRLLEWGAERVLGVDIRPENIRRAKLVRDHFGLDPERLSFQVSDVFDLPSLPRFDLVLCLGLVYHLENPLGALRIARALTRGLCLVESQLVEPHPPLRHGWGATEEYLEQEAAWAAYYEPDDSQRANPVASHGGVVSLIPNRAALEQALSAAGFSRVEAPSVPADANPQYLGGHRLVLAGRP